MSGSPVRLSSFVPFLSHSADFQFVVFSFVIDIMCRARALAVGFYCFSAHFYRTPDISHFINHLLVQIVLICVCACMCVSVSKGFPISHFSLRTDWCSARFCALAACSIEIYNGERQYLGLINSFQLACVSLDLSLLTEFGVFGFMIAPNNSIHST